MAERLTTLFLDLDNKWTYKEMARILSEEFEEDISIHTIKELIKTEEFDLAYNQLLPEVGHDPRYVAARSAAADMMSTALSQLSSLLTNADTPAGTRLKAIDMVLKINGVDKPSALEAEGSELARFLQDKNIDLHQTNIYVSPDYEEALKKYDVVEGEVSDQSPLDIVD